MHLSRALLPYVSCPFTYLFLKSGKFLPDCSIWIQSLLAALATWSLVHYLQKSLNLHLPTTMLLTFIPLALSLLCRQTSVHAFKQYSYRRDCLLIIFIVFPVSSLILHEANNEEPYHLKYYFIYFDCNKKTNVFVIIFAHFMHNICILN